MTIAINKIKTDSTQPRKTFEEIDKLAATIKREGMLQPILVDSTYRIIDGERRYRAAQLIGMKEVPVIVAEVRDDKKRLVWQCIEDIQHKDVPILERDAAWLRLWKQLGKISYVDMAKYLGVSDSTVKDAIERAQFMPTTRQPAGDQPTGQQISRTRGLPEDIRREAITKMQQSGIRANEAVDVFVNQLKGKTHEQQKEILATVRTDWSDRADKVIGACRTINLYLTPELLVHLPKIELILLTGSLTELKKKLKTYNAQEGQIVE
jgi:ParB family chromosome partitioning protein